MSASETVDAAVLTRYDLTKKLGKGAYGIVWRATEKVPGGRTVALKKIYDAFINATDAQRTFREIMFLKGFSKHENIIRLLEVMKAENDKDIYLVFEHMETDLHAVIHANILEDVHKRYILYQILKAMKFIHTGDVLHRDLKPSNILLNSECLVKVADFGLARSIASLQAETQKAKVLTDYVATRWYRAPEILLGAATYTKAVDMWSIGCILGEMLGSKPMFPGTTTTNQLERILEVGNYPSKEDIEGCGSPFAPTLLENIIPANKKTLEGLYPTAPSDAIALMKELLSFNPRKRLSAEGGLAHPYVSQFHSEAEELSCDHAVLPTVDDDTKISIEEYRTILYRDVCVKIGSSSKSLKEGAKEKEKKEKKHKKDRKGDAKEKKGKKKEKKRSSSGNITETRSDKKHHKEKKEKKKTDGTTK